VRAARSASTGSSRDAEIDGYKPASRPIEIAKLHATVSPNIETGRPAGNTPEIAFTSAMPPRSPIPAPTTDNVIDSMRNCMKISPSVAPIDLRSPISNSRSEIEILSTEKIPTPPIRSEMPAIEKNTMRQLRRMMMMFPRPLRMSLPTFSIRTSPMPLCARL
jgi:hypothetical protein